MACGGAFALLFAFGVLAGHAGDYSFAAIRARSLTGWMPELALMLIVIGTGSKAGLVHSTSAAAGPPGGAEPRLGAVSRDGGGRPCS